MPRRDRIVLGFIFSFWLLIPISDLSAQETASSVLPEAQIREIASRILKNADMAHCQPRACKILVTDFLVPSGFTSQFGLQLADQFSKELASPQYEFQVIDRAILKTYLEKERISPQFLGSDRATRWLGKEMNATAVLTGVTKDQGSSVQVQAKLLSCNKEAAAPIEEFSLPLPDSKNALSGFDPIVGVASKERWSSEPAAFAAGAAGTTRPVCLYCPPPRYSDSARAAKFEGQVALDAVVSEDGKVKWTRIKLGAPFGLNQEAVNIVRQWKFKPGTHDGKPVSVLLSLDLGFRLLN